MRLRSIPIRSCLRSLRSSAAARSPQRVTPTRPSGQYALVRDGAEGYHDDRSSARWVAGRLAMVNAEATDISIIAQGRRLVRNFGAARARVRVPVG